LAKFEREKTHRFWQELEDGAGSLHLLLTISGTTSSETISDLSSYEENPREKINIEARYVSSNSALSYLFLATKTVLVRKGEMISELTATVRNVNELDI